MENPRALMLVPILYGFEIHQVICQKSSITAARTELTMMATDGELCIKLNNFLKKVIYCFTEVMPVRL